MILTTLLVGVLAFLLGLILFPMVLFMRARRDDAWDDSNMTNIYRIVAHIATHPADFAKMQYPDGKRPFWYINKDEFKEVVKVRPNE